MMKIWLTVLVLVAGCERPIANDQERLVRARLSDGGVGAVPLDSVLRPPP